MARNLRALLAGLTMAGGLATAAAGFDGRYDAFDCADRYSDGVLLISGMVAEFHETRCQMQTPVNVRDMNGAVLFDMACEGEGETWQQRAMLMPGLGGGLVLVGPGFATTYARCD